MIVNGNALHLPLADNSVQCVVTSPPYFGLRDYGTAKWEGGDPECDHLAGPLASSKSTLHDGAGCAETEKVRVGGMPYRDVCPHCGARRIDAQLGLEPTPGAYVANLVAVFREVRRVLRPDGVCWLNLGDSYAGSGTGDNPNGKQGTNAGTRFDSPTSGLTPNGLKPKDLVGIPWRVAFALQADGWWLRSDIIWAKPNPMPESVKDRPTRSHEYLFLLTKAARYYYDADAVREPSTGQFTASKIKTWDERVSEGHYSATREWQDPSAPCRKGTGDSFQMAVSPLGRNRRDVWTITTKPYKGAHFATFPPALVEPCILAGSRPGDVVLDPFAGAGTVGLVASRLGRRHIGVELSLEYCRMAENRIYQDAPLLAGVTL